MNDQKYVENLIDTFATPGWKQLVEEMETALELTNDIAATTTIEQLYFRRGQIDILRRYLALEDGIRNALEGDE